MNLTEKTETQHFQFTEIPVSERNVTQRLAIESNVVETTVTTTDSVETINQENTTDSVETTNPENTADSVETANPENTADSVETANPENTADSVKLQIQKILQTQ